MLYSDIKRETLSHINQYSHGGSVVAASYNNQADYLNKIPHLINEAIVSIRTVVKPDPVVFALDSGEEYANMMSYDLPDDFWALRSGGVSVVRDGRFERTNDYRLIGKKHILVPKSTDSAYTVEYYRYPPQLDMNAKDFDELDEDIEVIQAATYYAAANLVMYDDEFAYAALYKDYESRLARISRGVTAEVSTVQDAYAFNAGW